MSIRSLKALFLGLSLFACTSVFAAPLVVNVAGIQSYGEFGDPNNTVLTYDVGANSTIVGLSYSVNVTAFSPSWLAELGFAFTDSDVTRGVIITPGYEDIDPGTGNYASVADLVFEGLSFSVGADGILRLEFFEGYDDPSIAPDGIWNAGTITFDIVTAGGEEPGEVPEPASMLLIGAGLAAMGYTNRRRVARKAALAA